MASQGPRRHGPRDPGAGDDAGPVLHSPARARFQSGTNASVIELVPSSGMGEQQAGQGMPAPCLDFFVALDLACYGDSEALSLVQHFHKDVSAAEVSTVVAAV